MSCKHTVTARSAKDPKEWKCLRCGATVPTDEQKPLFVFDNKPAGELVVEQFPESLPKPPARRE